MRKVFIIGIGAGNPEHMTVQAIQALQQVDVFFVADKGEAKDELEALRGEICRRFIRDHPYRLVRFADPQRAAGSGAYRASVQAWHAEREAIYERLLLEELADGACGAFLAWGDPALYDSTLRSLEKLRARRPLDLELELEVIPGISSVQVLTARHQIPLNRIGEAVHITTGRKLREGLPAGADSVVVMLDGECSFKHVAHEDLHIYWGAYLGTADELLIEGPLRDVMDEIEAARARARQQKGWILDIYLLRRGGPE